ncbi:cytochrome C oxidase subunit IV family protein [Desulfobulbus rhabdoformis]|jgi:cytochrome c oxidase subunit 4|uniref:cytochrome C oxidase subunit IV family protein n=1 Tax=Desulfobulbus rhabdoformis TaxID=34032 RepID=UPI001964D5AC|nr:cytochrome C oxidase subunit IV family protein [Desulfobulbus rhabdoformis]MBM9613634.1 cytochrome C oxidase subunit IV family protein [Desulfobulbus rhabdoformis]
MKENEQHILSYKTLALVLAALLVLTGLTIGVSYVHMGILNVPIALAIASTKVSFVLLYFMHLKFEGRAIKISFLCTICFLAIMISFTFWDVAYR